MICLNDSIQHMNVVSKSYRIPQSGLQPAIEDFINLIANFELHPTALPFYYVIPTKDNDSILKIFLPVKEDRPAISEEIHFSSYFDIQNMASVCLTRTDQELMTEKTLELFDNIEADGAKASTPLFFVMAGDTEMQYTFLKVGYK